MSRRRRAPRSVRKKLWRLLGFSAPREQRLAHEKTWRDLAPVRRALDSFTLWARSLMEMLARATRAFSALALSLSSLRKDDAHAFS